jgi:hypothetical protein
MWQSDGQETSMQSSRERCDVARGITAHAREAVNLLPVRVARLIGAAAAHVAECSGAQPFDAALYSWSVLNNMVQQASGAAQV